MTSISHALIGAAIASRIGNPGAVAALTLVTHFVCDAIPHWDLGTSWRLRPRKVTGGLALLETFVAVFGVFFIFREWVRPELLSIGIIFSLLPDWLEAPYFIFSPKAPKFFYYVYKVQSLIHSRMQAPWGVITQVVTVLAFLIVGFVM